MWVRHRALGCLLALGFVASCTNGLMEAETGGKAGLGGAVTDARGTATTPSAGGTSPFDPTTPPDEARPVGTGLYVSHAAMYPGGVLLGNNTGLLLSMYRTSYLVTVGPRVAHDSSQSDPGPRIAKVSADGSQFDVREYPEANMPELMTVDSTGAVVLAGQLYRSMSYGGPSIGPVTHGYYLVKLDASGNQLWARAVERPDVFWLRTLVVDQADNIYLGGEQADMSPGWYGHAHIAKFSADGSSLWQQQFQNTNSTGDINEITLFADGSVAVAGAFNGTMTVGSQSLTTTATAYGYQSYNGWFAQLAASDGRPLVVQRFGGAICDYANAIGITSTGRLRLAGVLSGQSSILGVTTSVHAEGSPFVAEVDVDSGCTWIRKLGTCGAVFAAATGDNDRTIAVGRFNAESEGCETSSSIDAPAFAAVVEADGTLSQLFTFRTQSNGASAVVLDGEGGAWITGEFTGTVAFGDYTLEVPDYQNFLIKLSSMPL